MITENQTVASPSDMKKGRLIAILTLLALGLGVVLWNQSRPGAERIDASYTARWQRNFRYQTPSFANPRGGPDLVLSSAGLAVLKEALLDARPVRNPIRIVWEHIRYWANQRLYPVHIRISSDTSDGWMAYYQRGKYIFLRQANHRHNAVLLTDHPINELEHVLLPFVGMVAPLDPTAPAEARPRPSDPDSANPQ